MLAVVPCCPTCEGFIAFQDNEKALRIIDVGLRTLESPLDMIETDLKESSTVCSKCLREHVFSDGGEACFC